MKIQKWAIDKLIPYELNAKKHDKAQVAKIAESIKLGWDQPIVVDAEGVIIKGHGRRLAAILMGLTEVPVLVRDDLTPDQVRAARLADNRVAMGDIDTEKMREDIQTLEFDLSGIFDVKELDFSEADLGTMNTDVFITDIDAAVTEQEAETRGKMGALNTRRIPLSKVFGFGDIQGSDEIYFTRFMAQVEQQSGLKGEAALVVFLKGLLGELSHT